jgi:hypothetical protein
MSRWFKNYFGNPAKISSGRRAATIVLGVLLFIALTVFGVIMVLQFTAFYPNYIASYVNDIDISNALTIWINENIAPQRPEVAQAAILGVNYFEPQIIEQLNSVVENIYSFFLERMEEGELLQTIEEQRPLVENVANNIQAIINLPVVQSVFNNLGIDASAINIQVNTGEINSFFTLIEKAAKFQQLIAFAKSFFIPSIFIVLALIAGIIFTGRKFRFIFIVLGAVFSIHGILQLAGLLPLGNYARQAITNLELSPFAHDSATRFVNDVIGMLDIFSAVILFAGLLLITAYFLTRLRKQTGGTT